MKKRDYTLKSLDDAYRHLEYIEEFARRARNKLEDASREDVFKLHTWGAIDEIYGAADDLCRSFSEKKLTWWEDEEETE